MVTTDEWSPKTVLTCKMLSLNGFCHAVKWRPSMIFICKSHWKTFMRGYGAWSSLMCGTCLQKSFKRNFSFKRLLQNLCLPSILTFYSTGLGEPPTAEGKKRMSSRKGDFPPPPLCWPQGAAPPPQEKERRNHEPQTGMNFHFHSLCPSLTLVWFVFLFCFVRLGLLTRKSFDSFFRKGLGSAI